MSAPSSTTRWRCDRCYGPNGGHRLSCADCGKPRDDADAALADVPLPDAEELPPPYRQLAEAERAAATVTLSSARPPRTPLSRVEDRYLHDNTFRAVVDTLRAVVERLELTPSEVREAAVFACVLSETRRGFPLGRPASGRCARCGVPAPASTPDHEPSPLCPRCASLAAAETPPSPAALLDVVRSAAADVLDNLSATSDGYFVSDQIVERLRRALDAGT